MADHNDPNAVNSIFSDIDVSAADLYDIFGFPSDDRTGGEKVVIALTFAAVPQAGVFDNDMLYRILLRPRPPPGTSGQRTTQASTTLLAYLGGGKDEISENVAAVRAAGHGRSRATARISRFIGFPGGDFAAPLDQSKSVVQSPGGHTIKVFVGGRDDAFFNDLTGVFSLDQLCAAILSRSAYDAGCAGIEDPKDLSRTGRQRPLQLRPAVCRDWGHGKKKELPAGPLTWNGNRFRKDQNGNFRFVYSGAGRAGGAELQCDHPRTAAGVFDRPAGRAPCRQYLGRKLGVEGVRQGRHDPRRSVMDRAPDMYCSKR